MSKYFLGLDLGQARDYTALAVLERIVPPQPPKVAQPLPYTLDCRTHNSAINEPPLTYGMLGRKKTSAEDRRHLEPRFECPHLERLALGTSYPDIIDHVRGLLLTPELRDQSTLVIDATGVGRPVCDMFTKAGLVHTGVIITGGDTVNRDGNISRVPKRILVSVLQVLLQTKRLEFAPNPLREVLIKELLDFQVTVTEAANDTYEGRSGSHDDLVLAVALAAWKANGYREPREQPRSVSSGEFHYV